MCGIAGYIHKNVSSQISRDDIAQMQKAIFHRGPDDTGYHASHLGAFINVRLAIVDRAAGHQPMLSEDGKVGIVFNGEIYNYLHIQSELKKRGYHFQSNCDTEVILKGYLEYGINIFHKLNGMFSICIWDERTDEIFIVRDGLGIKPLYIYEDENKWIFASELRAISCLPGVNLSFDARGIQDYLIFRYVQSPYTVLKHVRVLEAGSYLRIHKSVSARFNFYNLSYTENLSWLNEYELKEQLKDKLQNAVSSQLMGEVPIGVLLSGGLDSSAIAYFVRQAGADLTTFNIGFSEVNEFEYSRMVASKLGLRHVEITTSVEDIVNAFENVVSAIDHPIADPACFPLYLLAAQIKKEVTVVLSGEGGDELFGGYPQYRNTTHNSEFSSVRFTDFLQHSWYFLDSAKYLHQGSSSSAYLRNKKYYVEHPGLNGMLAYDMQTWMPENLMMKADKILMSYSLEGRFPFLDKELLEFSLQLDESIKYSNTNVGKWILKESMRGLLPDAIIDRSKMGFSVPLDKILHALKDQVMGSIDSASQSSISDIINLDSTRKLFRGYFEQQINSPLQVWTIFILLYWSSVVLPRIQHSYNESTSILAIPITDASTVFN